MTPLSPSQEAILDSIMGIIRFETGCVSEHRCKRIRAMIRECIWPGTKPQAPPSTSAPEKDDEI